MGIIEKIKEIEFEVWTVTIACRHVDAHSSSSYTSLACNYAKLHYVYMIYFIQMSRTQKNKATGKHMESC